MTFDEFQVGDYTVFEREFSAQDFSLFSQLSGDKNPLHHDLQPAPQYAAGGEPIVPLHLTLSPLSMIAGMIFPGKPSLYLGHKVQATKPVHYGDKLRYSARIEAINHSHRILSLRVVVLRGVEIVIDARMQVQATFDPWNADACAVIRKTTLGTAVITGASGEIGGAIAVALGRAGWRLVLLDRGADERRDRLESTLNRIGVKNEFLSANLSHSIDQDELSEELRKLSDVSLLVHTASPDVFAELNQLVEVNFAALKKITSALLPEMLARQSAAVLLIGSTAVRTVIPDWENYSAAKAMAINFVDGVERRFGAYGVRGFSILPGLVATRFSHAFRSPSDATLLPGEVAEAAVNLLTDVPDDNVSILEAGHTKRGRFGFFRAAMQPESIQSPHAPERMSSQEATSETIDVIAPTVREVLQLPLSFDLQDAGLGVTPGWDSLKHIELILAIEGAHGMNFTSMEIEAAHSYIDLLKIYRGKARRSPAEKSAS